MNPGAGVDPVMSEELEWKTRKERVDKKLKSLNPPWTIFPFLRLRYLDFCANWPTDEGRIRTWISSVIERYW
jgi:hypothetical protein